VTDMQTTPPANDVDPDVLRNLLQRIPLGAAQTILITRGAQLLTFRGALKQVEAQDVAMHVDQEWRDTGQTMRVQFMRLPLSPLSRLLAIYPLRDAYRLILIDSEDASLEPLRKLSNQLLSVLDIAGIGQKRV
jgi:hypothetical protein